ncbi:hypothetical protein PCANC_25271 [Puccinia coronata f. sp. avenae]|uniref:Armadillo-like helical domain-containing protein n=1 Tax=Puccinia coronata f. sp. avenae TaxID=200324 RepID=A0A2N5UBV1_9BASI|nr:hypothetical protein PCANC_25271 [Puccinia coronata f. sp. avenae]PLW35206.1 hypothetical protein PCASD_08579 [Puccinia coronata f. sp. avenae]
MDIAPATNPSEQPTRRRNLKWYSSIDQAFHPTDSLIPPENRDRFYWDLYLLTPDKHHLRDTLERLSIQELLGTHRQNLNDLIAHAIRALKNAAQLDSEQLALQPQQPVAHPAPVDHPLDQSTLNDQNEVDQIRMSNGLETLSAIFKTILNKEGYDNANLDLISLIAGSIENSDPVFSDFVYSVDKILSDQTQSLRTRHRTLQLALSVVSGVNQGSINAYFLRRDLFNTIASLIANPKSISLVFDTVLLLDLLANFRRFESRNPYLVRMEDYVDEKAMERIISLSTLALEDLREAYRDISTAKNTNSSLLGQVTSTVMNVLGTSSSPRGSAISQPVNQAFDSHPGRPACILLPIYDLLCSNTTFFNVLLSSQSFWESFLSFSSYLLSHASSNARSELYGRLVLVILIHLAEEGARFICGASEDSFKVTVKFCRDRQPPLGPSSDLARAPIAAMLDCGILYLRHNLQRKLKIETHLVCLRLIHELLFCLQSHQVRLDAFEWRELWRALFSLASRVGSRIDELKNVQDIDRLAQQLLDILSFAAIWSEVLFRDDLTTATLYFEILRSEETIKNLTAVANISSSGGNGGNEHGRHSSSVGRKSSLMHSMSGGGGGGGGSNLGVSTIEAVKNLNTIISKCKWILEQAKSPKLGVGGSVPFAQSFAALFSSSSSSSSNTSSSPGNGQPPLAAGPAATAAFVSSAEECLVLLQARLAEIGLLDSASLENHLRKYSETDKTQDLKKFIGLIPTDVFQLMVL